MTRREIAKKVAPLFLKGKNNKKLIKQLAALLVEEGKTKEIELLMNDVAVEMERLGHSYVEVQSTHKLAVRTLRDLEKSIKELTKAGSVTLNETIDQSLIGGLIATTPTVEIDLSVRTKLKALGGK